MNSKSNRKLRNIKCVFPAAKRIIVIGDIHGDLEATLQCLKKVRVIDKKGNWIGKKTVIVQVGDQIDRGGRDITYEDESSELKIINLFNRLHIEALRVGGAAYSLIGNHEIMNVMGDFEYASAAGIKAFGGKKGRKKMFKPGGPLARMMAINRYTMLRIGDCLFVHGGLDKYTANNYSIEDLNYYMRLYLNGNASMIREQEFQKLYLESNSVLWNRKFSSKKLTKKQCENLVSMLKCYNANYLFIGHTPQEKGINTDCGGRLWRVDTAMSNAFGERYKNECRIQVLEIKQTAKNKKVFTIHK
jgi:hypothetical protein